MWCRFAEGRFEPDMMATMGIDFRLKDIDVRLHETLSLSSYMMVVVT
jgi:hypothetical protein